ncbi:hypothetical protein RWE15_06610 [Virgibacillus halophilus]|uniref:Uncharacterized protein n=1 Tax=Tigheibacillus halophilus TaxID=361280 RepID=A0ABU5C4J4_9BACI|nr:hypothetical protein [Virgibacillus halophilus]
MKNYQKYLRQKKRQKRARTLKQMQNQRLPGIKRPGNSFKLANNTWKSPRYFAGSRFGCTYFNRPNIDCGSFHK